MFRRKKFIGEFESFVRSAYERFVERGESPSIEYRPTMKFAPSADEREFVDLLKFELQAKKEEEQRMGTTLAGPQRDEFMLKIDGLELRKFASQGQHKTFLVAVKIAEFFFLKERCYETPILLLDDVFSELDEHRTAKVLQFAGELSQTFITSTSPHLFESTVSANEGNKRFFIHNGTAEDWKATVSL